MESFVSDFCTFAPPNSGSPTRWRRGHARARSWRRRPAATLSAGQALASAGTGWHRHHGRAREVRAHGHRSGAAHLSSRIACVHARALLPVPASCSARHCRDGQDGQTAFARQLGTPLNDYLEQHPELDDTLGRAMGVLRTFPPSRSTRRTTSRGRTRWSTSAAVRDGGQSKRSGLIHISKVSSSTARRRRGRPRGSGRRGARRALRVIGAASSTRSPPGAIATSSRRSSPIGTTTTPSPSRATRARPCPTMPDS